MATARTVYRDFSTDGVPSSGKHTPKKSDIRTLLTSYETIINAFTSSGGLVYLTRADLYADLAHAAKSMAWVVQDPDPAKNGIYQKSGASGAGAWARVADLPHGLIIASDVGDGTPNAIQATTAITVTETALVLLNVFEANTNSPVTVSFNGGDVLTVKTATGADVPAGALTPDMGVLGRVAGDTYRMLSDASYDAVMQERLTTTTQAKNDAQTAAGAAATSETNAATSEGNAAASAGAAASTLAAVIGAAEAGGQARIFDTTAAATAAISTIADQEVVEVLIDEGYGGDRTRYRKESGSLVFKRRLDQTGDQIGGRQFSPVFFDAAPTYIRTILNARALPQMYEALGDDGDDTVAFQHLADNMDNGAHILIPPGVYVVGAAVAFAQDDLTIEMAPGAVIKQKGGTQTIDTLIEFAGDGGRLINPAVNANVAGNDGYTGRGEIIKISGDDWDVVGMRATGSAVSDHGAALFTTGNNITVTNFRSRYTGRFAIRNKGNFNTYLDLDMREWRFKGFCMDADVASMDMVTIKGLYAYTTSSDAEQGLLIDPDLLPLEYAKIRDVYIDTPNSVLEDNIKIAYVHRVDVDGLVSKIPATSHWCSLRIQQEVRELVLRNATLDANINFDATTRCVAHIGGATTIGKSVPVASAIEQFWGDLVIDDGVSLMNYSAGAITFDATHFLDSTLTAGALVLHGASGTPSLVKDEAIIQSSSSRRVIAGAIAAKDPISITGTAKGPFSGGGWMLPADSQDVAAMVGGRGAGRVFRASSTQMPPTDSDGWLRGDRIIARGPSASSVAEIVCVTAGPATACATAWASSTAYTVGARRYKGSAVYTCTIAGTSAASGGPTGTGTGITDGTAVWDYVAPLAVFKTKSTLAA